MTFIMTLYWWSVDNQLNTLLVSIIVIEQRYTYYIDKASGLQNLLNESHVDLIMLDLVAFNHRTLPPPLWFNHLSVDAYNVMLDFKRDKETVLSCQC